MASAKEEMKKKMNSALGSICKAASHWAAQGKSWEWFTMRAPYQIEFFTSEEMNQVYEAFEAAQPK